MQIDRTLPGLADPVTGGTGLVWVNTPSVTVTGGGAIDPPSGGGPGSGIDHYQYRTSADGGAHLVPVTTGTGVTVTAPRGRRSPSSGPWTRPATSAPGRAAQPTAEAGS